MALIKRLALDGEANYYKIDLDQYNYNTVMI